MSVRRVHLGRARAPRPAGAWLTAVIALAAVGLVGGRVAAEDAAPRPQPTPAPAADASSPTQAPTPFERADVRAVAERITCYCGCPHLQVSKCFCATADQIRDDIAARLDAGASPGEIIAAFTEEHGTGALAVPPLRGFNWSVWLSPVVGLLGGVVVVTLLARRWVQRDAEAREKPAELMDAEVRERYRAEIARALEDKG